MLGARLSAALTSFRSLAILTSVALLPGCGPEQRGAPSGVEEAPAAPDAPQGQSIGAAQAPGAGLALIERRIAAGERRFRRGEREFSALNGAQRLETRFDARGARFGAQGAADDDGIALRLTSWGRGKPETASEVDPALGACAADGSVDEQGACIERLELARGGLTEWWENRSDGLEQGFALAERPAGTLPLRIEIRVDGARVAIDAGGAGATFETARGFRLRYSALRAVDAEGRGVPARMASRPGGLALEVDDRDARYPLLVDPLITSSTFTAESNQPLAAFGYSAAGAGDVNGDGFADVIVGAWLYDNGQTDEGRAFLFLGSASGLAATAAWTAEPDQAGASFGRTVASAGDVNGDGFSDVIVGAPDYSNDEAQEGAVFLYLGSASGLAAMPAWTGEGGQDGAQLGLALSSAGDVNRDGRSDIVVGAPYYDNGQLDEGQARVYLGTAMGLAATPVWTGESDQIGAYYGTSVARAGDVNRDSYGDIVVGAPYYDNGNTDEGRTYSYNGSASGPVATAWAVEGGQDTAYFGNSIAGAGDVNGDGYADVIVGASSFTNGHADEGRATVYYGSAMGLSATANWSFEPNQIGAEAGASVASIGDENGDGYSDVAVGVPGYDNGQVDEGRVYFFVGSANGPVAATLTPTSTESDQAGAAYGRSVAAAGDVNGDGYADAVIGAPNYDNGQADEGRVFVLNGSGSAIQTLANTITTTLSPNPWSVGDVNGDGFGDVVMGMSGFSGAFSTEGQLRLYPGSDAGLTTPTSWAPTGGQANVGLGIWVTGAGDVNGDGYADILASMPNYDGPAQDTGRAVLFLGSPTGPSATPDWTVDGEATFQGVGSAIASGDVNGDGFSDVLIGFPGYTSPEMSEGRVAVYFGSASGLPAAPSATIDGNAASAQYGQVLIAPGDVDGDGISDFMFTGRVGGVRSVLVYRGTTSGTWSAPFQTLSLATVSMLSRAGDVNGDGYADVLVVFPRTLYFGSPSGFTTPLAWNPNVGTANVSDRFNAGDVNGDGYSDIVVYLHEPGIDSIAGYLGSPSGLPTNASFAFSAGGAVTLVDVNGDGFSDLIAEYMVGMTGFRTWHGNSAETTSSAFAYAPQARRTGTSTPIAPEGLAQGGAFDARLLGRTAFGRGKLKLAVETKPVGATFNGLGLTTGAAWTDSGSAGVDLAQAVTGLTGNAAYHFRTRVKYDPALGFPQGWSRWLYGGNLDSRLGIHIRSSCVSGDTDGDGTPDCSDGCPNNPSKIAPGACGCAAPDTDSDGDSTPNCIDGCPNNAPKIAPGVCGCATPDTDSDGDGTPNCNDSCPNNAPKTAPGVCGCATPDTDSDGDGTPNCNDLCPNNAPKVAPGACGCATPDTDSDGDGTPNCNDLCPNNAPKIAPGVCGCAVADTDSDGDGTPNCNDSCPNDPNKTVPGACGCGVSDADSDGDGTQNCNDSCPNDASKTAPGLCGCGVSDVDSDGDGTPNCNDACPNDVNKLAPGVCGCGTSDVDGDSDGTPNCHDGCPNDSSKIAAGVCGCGVSDADSDGDGTPNCTDGCPNDQNKTAPGVCGCGQPEVTNCGDNCPNDPNKTAPGVCGCGNPDTDSDADGTPNCNDNCPNDPGKIAPGVCGCGDADTDSDSDGTPNCNDGCPNDPGKTMAGVCGCGTPDADPDNDGTPSCNDDCPNDRNKIAPGVCGCGVADTDTDGDATPNCDDDCPNDSAKTAPGACGCGALDDDTDGDGKLDCHDDCPTEAASTTNGCPDGGGGAGGEGGGAGAGAGDGGSGDTGGSSGRGGASTGGRGGAARGGSSSGNAGDGNGAGEGGEAGEGASGGSGGASGDAGGTSGGASGGGLGGGSGTGGKKKGPSSDESSGCGCRVVGPTTNGDAGRALGLLLVLTLVSRRRRRAAAHAQRVTTS